MCNGRSLLYEMVLHEAEKRNMTKRGGGNSITESKMLRILELENMTIRLVIFFKFTIYLDLIFLASQVLD